ncbi:hypothetical protein MMC13_004590 [Lambiella insularis]|nr:hypothetical protein [Lambiella insularis]
MVMSKPKSKRTPVRLRHKIEKASAAKQRKQRKLSKANPEWRSRIKKDPGIPNLFPYKDRILHEIEEKKRLKEEQLTRKREEAKVARGLSTATPAGTTALEAEASAGEEGLIDDEAMDTDSQGDSTNPMAALLASAKAQAAEYEEMSDDDSRDVTHDNQPSSKPQAVDTSRRSFTKTFDTVLSASDVLLYVLDARDPSGTRSRHTERQIASASGGSKRLILILNKIDLVPPRVLKDWLTYLRRYFPTLPLRASNPAPNTRTFDHKALTRKATSETLLRALKSYAAEQNLKRAITVGVIGYPNVGKSSVINALTSCLGGKHASRTAGTACPVGAEAGVTTAMREVKLDNKLKLLDCPGIVFPSVTEHPAARSSSSVAAHLHLLSALPPSAITDPVPAISLLLTRLHAHPDQTLLKDLYATYNLPPLMTSVNESGEGDVTTDFLVQVARKRGRLGKGGVPNLSSAAMGVLGDWRDGRLRGWVEAPALKVVGAKDAQGDVIVGDEAGSENEEGDRKEIVTAWGTEFKLEGLWGSREYEGEGDGMEE